MQNITSSTELKNAILLLEEEQAYKGKLLKEQFFLTYDSLKRVNILGTALKEIARSTNITDNILSTAIGLGTGYLSKKIVVGASGNIIRKVIGSFLQLGVTNVVAHHPDSVKSIGQLIFQYLFRKKKINSEKFDK